MCRINKTFALFLTISITIASIVVEALPLGLAQTGTNISGIISQETTWTKERGPYQLTGNITVNSGTTLIIEAGTTVNLESYTIQVFGTLIAKGNSTNKIHFNGFNDPNSYQIIFNQSSTSWNELTNTGCIIEDTVINVASILIGDASPKINHSTFGGANIRDRVGTVIYVNGGSAIISNNTITPSFKYCAIEIRGGSPNVCNNYITNPYAVYSGIIVSDCDNALVHGNSIDGFAVGILVWGGKPTIERNDIENNIIGIEITGDSQISVFIQNNTITKNDVGIDFGKNFASSSVIRLNNIETVGQSTYTGPRLVDLDDGFFGEPYTINAVYNWWGTTDAEAINKTVNIELVNLGWDSAVAVSATVIPILTSPNPQALPEDYNHPEAIPYPSPYPTLAPSQTTSPTNSPSSAQIEYPASTLVPTITETPNQSTEQSSTQTLLYVAIALLTVVIALLIVIIMTVRKNRMQITSKVANGSNYR
jgi:hypothetical protein